MWDAIKIVINSNQNSDESTEKNSKYSYITSDNQVSMKKWKDNIKSISPYSTYILWTAQHCVIPHPALHYNPVRVHLLSYNLTLNVTKATCICWNIPKKLQVFQVDSSKM